MNLTALTRRHPDSQSERRLRLRNEHLKPFLQACGQIAPWLGEAEIGFRIHSTLGIRSAVIRDRGRLRELTGDRLDLDDVATVIALMVDVIAPIFSPPPAPARL